MIPLGIFVSVPATIAYTDVKSSAANATSYTPTDSSIGAADAHRVVAAVIHATMIAASTNVNAVTLGGSTPTLANSTFYSAGGTSDYCWVYYRAIPTGTTVSFSITFSQTFERIAVHFYRIVTAAPTPHASNTSTGSTSSPSTTVNVPSDGVALAGLTFNGSSVSWAAPMTEDRDEANGQGRISVASLSTETARTPLSVTPTIVSPTRSALVAVSWGP